MNKAVKAFVIFSVFLNLLLLGIVVGNAGQYFMSPHSHRSLEEIAAAMPADKRPLVEASIKRAEQDTEDLRDQLKNAHKDALAALQAEPFDKQAYFAHIKRVQDLRGKLTQRMSQAIADMAAQCTPAERAVLADMLRDQSPVQSAPHNASPQG